jgi:hypothetical protein
MTITDDLDRIAQTWILEGPDRLADRVLDHALAQVHGTTQRRGAWASGRVRGSTPAMRRAAVFAIVMIVAGATLLIGGQRDRSIGISPSQTPSPSLSPSPSISFETFFSPIYHYSIDRPSAWAVEPGTQDWPPQSNPVPDGAGVDRFISPEDRWTRIVVTSDALEPGEVVGERQAILDQTNAQACQFRDRSVSTLGGVDARREVWFCFDRDWVTELFAAHAGRVYIVDLITRSEPSHEVLALFEHVVASLRYEE